MEAVKNFSADEQERLGKVIEAKNGKIEEILGRLADAQKQHRKDTERISKAKIQYAGKNSIIVSDPAPERIEGSNYLKLVRENHELQKNSETLERQVGVLKTFVE